MGGLSSLLVLGVPWVAHQYCLTTVLGVRLSRYPFDVLLVVKCMLDTFDVSSGTAPRNDQVCLLLITAMDICVLQTGLPVDNALASAN